MVMARWWTFLRRAHASGSKTLATSSALELTILDTSSGPSRTDKAAIYAVQGPAHVRWWLPLGKR